MLAGCRKGDENSWRQLFEIYYPLAKWVVAHTIYQLDPQEVNSLAQDGMIAVVRNIDKIEDEEHLKRFLKRATRNKCIDFIRRNKQQFEELDVAAMVAYESNSNETVIAALEEAVNDLKEPCNSIVKARFLEGLSYKEIAAKISLKAEQVGTRLQRCLRFLRTFLETHSVFWEDVL